MRNGPYELVIAPEDFPGKKYRGRYAYEHTVLFWKAKGVIPKRGFELHHKNGNHRDNRLSNLELITSTEHRRLHGAIATQKATVKIKCGFCEKSLSLIRRTLRMRLKQNKFGKIFCTRSCGAKHQHSRVP